MKNLICVVASAIALAVLADTPFSKMSKDDIAKSDNAKWSGGYMMGGEILKTHNENKERVNALRSAIYKVSEREALAKPEKSAALDDLWGQSGRNLRFANLPAMNAADSNNKYREQGWSAMESYRSLCARLDSSARPALYNVLDALIGRHVVELHARWKKASSTLEHLKFSDEFAKFDAAFGDWMKSVDEIRRNRVDDVVGTELMMATKLDRYANDDCRKLPYLDSDSRIVDKLLLPLREEERKAFTDGCSVLAEQLDKLSAALKADRAAFELMALDIHPKDRPDFLNLFAEMSNFIEETKRLVEDSRKMIAAAADPSTEVGRLRSNTGFSPNRAFECAGPTQSNGCPGYSRRIRVALEDCKNAYLKAYRANKGYDAKWE